MIPIFSIHLEDRGILWRLVTRERDELRHVRALVAHALDAADAVQQRRCQTQVVQEQRLAPEQRQHALVNLDVAPVDAAVVGRNHPRQLHVLVVDRLKRAIELRDDEVQATHHLFLEPVQLITEPGLLGLGAPSRRPLGIGHVCLLVPFRLEHRS